MLQGPLFDDDGADAVGSGACLQEATFPNKLTVAHPVLQCQHGWPAILTTVPTMSHESRSDLSSEGKTSVYSPSLQC